MMGSWFLYCAVGVFGGGHAAISALSSCSCRPSPDGVVCCYVTFVGAVTCADMVRFSSLLDLPRSTTRLSSSFHAARAVSPVTCVSSWRVSWRSDSWTYSSARARLRHFLPHSLTGSDPHPQPPTLCGECRGLPLPPSLADPVRVCEPSQAGFDRLGELVGVGVQPGGVPPPAEPIPHPPDSVRPATNMRENQHKAGRGCGCSWL